MLLIFPTNVSDMQHRNSVQGLHLLDNSVKDLAKCVKEVKSTVLASIYIYIYILKGKRLIIDEANLNNKIYFRANDASGTMCEAYATARNCNENVFVQKRCKKSCGLCRKCHNLSYMMHYILLIFILLENLILGNILMPIIFYSLNQGLPFQKRSTSTSTV